MGPEQRQKMTPAIESSGLMRGWVLVNKNECAGVEVSWGQERDLHIAMVVQIQWDIMAIAIDTW